MCIYCDLESAIVRLHLNSLSVSFTSSEGMLTRSRCGPRGYRGVCPLGISDGSQDGCERRRCRDSQRGGPIDRGDRHAYREQAEKRLRERFNSTFGRAEPECFASIFHHQFFFLSRVWTGSFGAPSRFGCRTGRPPCRPCSSRRFVAPSVGP